MDAQDEQTAPVRVGGQSRVGAAATHIGDALGSRTKAQFEIEGVIITNGSTKFRVTAGREREPLVNMPFDRETLTAAETESALFYS